MAPFVDKAVEMQRLVKALRSQGKTPSEIAERVGVGVRTVYRWEKGETGPQKPHFMGGLNQMLAEVA
jgi:transposase